MLQAVGVGVRSWLSSTRNQVACNGLKAAGDDC